MTDQGVHDAPDWLAALIHAPAGGVVTAPDLPPPAEARVVVAMTVEDVGDSTGGDIGKTEAGESTSGEASVGETVGGETFGESKGADLRALPVAAIRPHPGQPRRSMDEAELRALADSIAEQGMIQPIVVRPLPHEADAYEIVAGERRWRAARLAGLETIPALVRPLDDAAMAEVALVENIQRADLPPLDEAFAYQQLIDAHGRTQDDIARRLGKNRSHVAHMLRLLRLPEEVQAMIRDGGISVGHARVLVNAADPVALARRVVAEGLTVRQTEEAAKLDRAEPVSRRPAAAGVPTPADAAWAQRFGDLLARPVAVKPGKRGGSLVIHYDSEDDLASILARISR
jgi:ParB family transcriptional regulator, chromosome partitioning protein